MEFWHQIRHFLPKEFDDPDYPGSHTYMDSMTIILADRLRHRTGWPIRTNNKHGVYGCVCMTKGHHSADSFHNYDNPNGCSAIDCHFVTDASPREQARAIHQSGFTGIGIYQDCWEWPTYPAREIKGKKVLPIGFHLDRRPAERFQVWKREDGEYIYLLR